MNTQQASASRLTGVECRVLRVGTHPPLSFFHLRPPPTANRQPTTVLFALLTLFLLAAFAPRAEAVTPCQMQIMFGGYTNRSEMLNNFPVLVVLSNNVGGSSSFNYNNFAATNGYDLRFATNSTDTTNSLNYEIESWNTNGASYVWVQVPTIPADGSGAIWANWGSTSASNQLACTTNGATWANGYAGVWHMTQTNAQDSTANLYNGFSTNNVGAVGYVGTGQSFSSGNTLNFPGPTWQTNVFSISCWLKPSFLTNWNQAIGAGTFWGAFGFHADASGLLYAGIDVPDPGGRFKESAYWSSNNWTYFTFTDNTNACSVYKNGGVLESRTLSAPTTNWGGFKLSSVVGVVDEVRISSVARSTNWVWAEYLTMASNTVFNNYGAMTGVAATPTITVGSNLLAFGTVVVNTTNVMTNTVAGANLTDNITITAPSPYTISTNAVDYSSSLVLTTNASGAVPTTNLYVRLIPTSPGSCSAACTNISGTVTSVVTLTATAISADAPMLYVTPGSLAFGNVITNTFSTTYTFTVLGSNLEADVTITAPTAFTVSTNPSGTYGQSCTVSVANGSSPSGANLASQTIWVRFNPPNATSYSGSIICSSIGAVSPTKAVSGTGVGQDANHYYVAPAPGGNDSNPGTLDQPFATLAKARDVVRTVSASMTGDITVYLRGGMYALSAPFALDARDSGTNGFNVVYAAYPGEFPVISGGRTISGWTLHNAATNIWKATVPGLDTRQLYVNCVRATRAHRGSGLTGATKTSTGYTTSESNMQNWGNKTNIEFVYNALQGGTAGGAAVLWTEQRCSVQSISGTTITMADPGWTRCAIASARGNQVVTTPTDIENAYELLDQAGEWYLDKTAGVIYYIPRAGEDLSAAKVIAPVLETLVSASGTIGNPIHNVQFRGLTFAHATWLDPNTNGYPEVQSGWCYVSGTSTADYVYYWIPGNISVRHASFVGFERCVFKHLGAGGLELSAGVQNSSVSGCAFSDISGAPIRIGDVSDPTRSDVRLRDTSNTVENCYIHDVPCEYRGGPGIIAGYVSDLTLQHNEIGWTTYSAISVGWGWGTYSYASNNHINDNNLHHYCRELSDGGGIYTLSAQTNSEERGNFLHDVTNNISANTTQRRALYTDEGSAYLSICNNVVANIANARWYSAWVSTIHDNHIFNNYTDTSSYENNGTRCVMESNTVVSGGNWPQAALDIMTNAGIEAGWADVKSLVCACSLLGSDSAILTSPSSVSVPEGGTNTFQVCLSSQPTSDVMVAVAWTAGDSDITVTGGANLTFTTTNWATYQTVTLAAAEDADAANGSATIICSSAGLVSGSVTATEVENDATLTVNASAGGSTAPSGATVVTQGAATGISATAGAGYVFANWSVTSGAATFANSNAASTTVTLSAPATVQANFIHVAIQASVAFVGVPEGGTAKFRVNLSACPAGSVTVNVAHGGDSQITVQSGSSLVFSTSDWSLWKTVTLTNVEDGVVTQRVATFTCSSAGMDPVIVTATGIDNDGPVPVDSDGDGLPDVLEAQLGRATNALETLTALPFTERFESDTVSLGLLHGQHNWVVNPTNAATVQTSEVFEGAQALRIEGTNDSSVAVSQVFTSTPQTVWMDLRIKVAGAVAPGSIPDAASVFFFNDAGRLVVCDGARPAGSQWITLTNTASRQAGTWARLTARADYALQTWALYLDGTNVASNLGFAMPQQRPICLSAEGPTGILDGLYVGAVRPDGIPGSSNTAPDDWYLDYFGTLAYGDTDDPDHDGMNNLAEYLAGTNPNDITSLLELTDALTTPATPGKFIVRWQSATGRVYLLKAATNLMTGFSTLTNGIPATPTVNVYTDAVSGAVQKFYKVEVE